jgi:hypothetical protein
MKHLVTLSPTTLNLFLECPRCFWLQINKSVRRPFTPFPSLPGGVEEKVKRYFDAFRRQGTMPPEVKGKLDGDLFPDVVLLNKWRNWRQGISFYSADLNARMMGAIDDLLVNAGVYMPLDYKSRGSAPTPDSPHYYQNQLDCYALLLERNGYKTSGVGYLVFYYPANIYNGAKIALEFTPVIIKTNPERADATFHQAVSVLRGPLPGSSPTCDFCKWTNLTQVQSFA